MYDTCGKQVMHAEVWLEKLKRRDLLGNLGIDRRIILKWILVS
jgi:hypothetical protein